LSLVRELERQGIGQKVIADMFGLALRSYQQKVQRLSESATDRGLTLWEAVHAHIQRAWA
jgi:predicted acetyltransferase